MSNGRSTYFAGPYPTDGGPTDIFETDGTSVRRLVSIVSPALTAIAEDRLLVSTRVDAQHVALLAVDDTGATQQVTTFSGYTAQAVGVGKLIAVSTLEGLTVFDPASGRSTTPDPTLSRVSLPVGSNVPGGFFFTATQGDAGTALYFYLRADDSVRSATNSVGAPRQPQSVVGLGSKALFWARDTLGMALWTGTADAGP
jgi:hypothetical protein